MIKNDDYKKGIRFLLQKSKEHNFNIHKYPWVCELSRLLSFHCACYKFWWNVCEQNRLKRIKICNTPDDFMYRYGKTLFTWDRTKEGGDYWFFILAEKLFPLGTREIKLDELRLMTI